MFLFIKIGVVSRRTYIKCFGCIFEYAEEIYPEDGVIGDEIFYDFFTLATLIRGRAKLRD